MTNFEISPEMQADKAVRFAHYIVDYLAFIAIVAVLMIVIGSLSDAIGNTALSDWLMGSSFSVNFFYVMLYLMYCFIMGTMTSRTLAKFLTGTIVIDEFGEKPSAITIFYRTICRLIPFDNLSFFGSRGWHDRISGTYVVKKHIYLKRKNEVIEMDEIGTSSEVI